MSSRALRKAQKQREEDEALKRLQQEAEEVEESDDEEVQIKPQQSAFALLDADGDDDDDNDDEDDDEADKIEAKQAPRERDASPSTSEDEPAKPQQSQRKKNKKKKKKSKAVTKVDANEGDIDDIDAALAALRASDASSAPASQSPTAVALSRTCQILAIESHNLHAANEMRRLFGRTAMEQNDTEDQPGDQGRRRGRNQQMAGLAAALGRRQGAQGGRSSGLGLLGLRRNLFIQGKEDWPIGTSGGLAMEIVEKREDGTVLYRFTHNSTYQDVQGDFHACVRGMDPERMIHLLQLNPYHISTLLQVSEIAKQERDSATSGDLLERALFTFGRSLHSTFASSLAQGKARLDFRRPENREFWLAVSRYITNLSSRATWRTVFEWTKLLLSLDPERDPYCLYLVIDHYALRARQPQVLIDMAADDTIGAGWSELPNIQLSLGLALVQTGQTGKGKQALFKAVNRFPWVVARLFQELNVDAPPGIWGKSPRTDWEKLCSEFYAVQAKDIWNTPETSNLLVEVSAAVTGSADPPIPERAITIDEGRHVILSDKSELIAHLPKSISGQLKSSSDPLPPDDNVASYYTRTDSGQRRTTSTAGSGLDALYEALNELNPAMLRGMHEMVLEQRPGWQFTEAQMESVLQRGGVSPREWTALYESFVGSVPDRAGEADESDEEDEEGEEDEEDIIHEGDVL